MPRGVWIHLSFDRSTDDRHMDSHQIGDLLHLERHKELRTIVEKAFLIIDDRLSDLVSACYAAARSSRSAIGRH